MGYRRRVALRVRLLRRPLRLRTPFAEDGAAGSTRHGTVAVGGTAGWDRTGPVRWTPWTTPATAPVPAVRSRSWHAGSWPSRGASSSHGPHSDPQRAGRPRRGGRRGRPPP